MPDLEPPCKCQLNEAYLRSLTVHPHGQVIPLFCSLTISFFSPHFSFPSTPLFRFLVIPAYPLRFPRFLLSSIYLTCRLLPTNSPPFTCALVLYSISPWFWFSSSLSFYVSVLLFSCSLLSLSLPFIFSLFSCCFPLPSSLPPS